MKCSFKRQLMNRCYLGALLISKTAIKLLKQEPHGHCISFQQARCYECVRVLLNVILSTNKDMLIKI